MASGVTRIALTLPRQFGLSANRVARRRVADYFMENYDALNKRYSDSFGVSQPKMLGNPIADPPQMSYLIKGSLASLSSKEDLAKVKAFFKDKDVRRFRLSVAQVYDTIQAASDWLERDQKDVEEVRTRRGTRRGKKHHHRLCDSSRQTRCLRANANANANTPRSGSRPTSTSRTMAAAEVWVPVGGGVVAAAAGITGPEQKQKHAVFLIHWNERWLEWPWRIAIRCSVAYLCARSAKAVIAGSQLLSTRLRTVWLGRWTPTPRWDRLFSDRRTRRRPLRREKLLAYVVRTLPIMCGAHVQCERAEWRGGKYECAVRSMTSGRFALMVGSLGGKDRVVAPRR